MKNKTPTELFWDHLGHATQGAVGCVPLLLVAPDSSPFHVWLACNATSFFVGFIRELDQLRRSSDYKRWKNFYVWADTIDLWHLEDRWKDIFFHVVGAQPAYIVWWSV